LGVGVRGKVECLTDQDSRLRFQVLGFRDRDLKSRVYDVWCMLYVVCCMVEGSESMVQGSRYRIMGKGFGV
jgi:hypothetical protein